MYTKKALLMIDLQNDFCTGGNLAVPHGEEVIPLANQLQKHFDLVVATQDWHPAHHASFAANHPGRKVGEVIDLNGVSQILWPAHCVQGSLGAAFHPQLNTQKITKIFQKGADPLVDSYSAFFDNARLHATGLGDYLQAAGVKDIYIMGLATNFCVKYSVLDALSLKLNVFLIEEACRGIDLKPGDVAAAVLEMKAAGAHVVDANAHFFMC